MVTDSTDLFRGFNEEFRRRVEGSVGVVLGPPASGKCFVIMEYLGGGARESIIGFTNLKPVNACGEHEAAESLIKGAEGEGPLDRVIKFFTNVFPWVKALRDNKSVDKAVKELEEHGFSKVELGSFREYFGSVGRVPRLLVNYLVELRSRYKPVVLYHIPWDDNKYILGDDVGSAVKLIKKHFSNGIKWLGAKYIPPGFVAEVVNKLRDSGDAEGYVKQQAEAYYGAIKLLVGEKDVELEGLVAMGIVNSIKQFATDGLKRLISLVGLGTVASLAVSSITLAMVQSLIYQLTKTPGRNPFELIELRRYWQSLHSSLKRIVASKVAIQMGITPKEAEEAINQLTGVDEGQLRQLIENIQARIEELERRVENLGREVNLLEAQVKGFKIYGLGDIADGSLYPNIKLVGNDLGIVSETYGKLEVSVVRAGRFNEHLGQLRDSLSKGAVVLTGPRGIGKSVLTVYTIWSLLREGGYYGVVRLKELTDPNARLSLENFLERYAKNFAETFGKLIILYDPSPPEAYTTLSDEADIRHTIAITMKQLIEIMNRLSELKTSLIIVVPSDMYNELSKDVRRAIGIYTVNINLGDEEFLKSIIRNYSNCSIDEGKLGELTRKILNYSEGYTLVARLTGELIRKEHCKVDDAERMLDKAGGVTRLFIASFLNRLLGIKDITNRGTLLCRDRARAVAYLLSIRQPFAKLLNPGDAIMPSGVAGLLLGWGIGGYEGKTDRCDWGFTEEAKRWLSIKHHSLIEDTLNQLLAVARGGNANIPRDHENTRPWANVCRDCPQPSGPYDIVEWLLEKHGKDLANELQIHDNCWKRFALALGTALTGHPFRIIASIVGEYGYEAAKPCGIDDYLLEEGELTPLTRMLLIVMAIKLIPEGFADKYNEAIKEIDNLINRAGGGVTIVEAPYALGLASLIAQAAKLGKLLNRENAEKALTTVLGSVQRVRVPSLVGNILITLSPLGERAPNWWAAVLSASTIPTVVNDQSLVIIIRDELDKVRGQVSEDWVIATLVIAYSNLLESPYVSKEEADSIHSIVCDLLGKINDNDTQLKMLAETNALVRFIRRGLGACRDRSFEERAKELLNGLEQLEKMGQIQISDQLRKYLTSKYLLNPEEAIKRELSQAKSFLLHSLGYIKLYAGELIDAHEYFEKAAQFSEEIRDWRNYWVSCSKAIGCRVLMAENIEKAVKASKYSEDLWKTMQEKLRPTAEHLSVASCGLARYLVYLTIAGRQGEVENLLREYGWLFKWDKYCYVSYSYLLRIFSVGVEKPKPEELWKALKAHIQLEYKPALKVALGLKVEKEEAVDYCSKFITPWMRNLCIDAYLAVKGNNEAFNKIRNIIRGMYRDTQELLNVLQSLEQKKDAKGLIQIPAPENSFGRLVLLLRALDSEDRELALAHALWGKQILKELFGELVESLNNKDDEGMKLALLKLLNLHL